MIIRNYIMIYVCNNYVSYNLTVKQIISTVIYKKRTCSTNKYFIFLFIRKIDYFSVTLLFFSKFCKPISCLKFASLKFNTKAHYKCNTRVLIGLI